MLCEIRFSVSAPTPKPGQRWWFLCVVDERTGGKRMVRKAEGNTEAGSGLQQDVRILNGSGKGGRDGNIKHTSDTRTRERGKGHPIASATSLLGEHVVRKRKRVQSAGAAFVPHINWQNSVSIGGKERRTPADEVTPSDIKTRFFYRSHARMRSIPHKTPEMERPIKDNARWAGERRSWRWDSLRWRLRVRWP